MYQWHKVLGPYGCINSTRRLLFGKDRNAGMKVKEWKQIADVLGRFALVRETAKFPQDRLLIQAANGVVKIVAIAPHGTMVATAHDTTEDFRKVIRSRDFLQYVKGLPAKGQELTITEAGDNWENGVRLGTMFFEHIGHELPEKFYAPNPIAQDGGHVSLTSDELDELARLVDGIADSREDARFVQFAGEITTGDSSRIRVNCWDTYKWAQREYAGNYAVFGCTSAAFVSALRGIGDCRIEFDPAGSQVSVQGGRFRAYGEYQFLTYRVPVERIGVENPSTTTVTDRSALIKSIREQTKFDTYGRIWLQYDNNVLRVVPFEKGKHGWGCDGKKLLSILTSISAKKIGFGLRTGRSQPIQMRIPNWEIELAPVVLSKKKLEAIQ